ncbi:MAG TPA: hypothetical protein PKC31_00880 [Candidatus Nanoperiomorbaceae bacterium]|nr:hypothetical protein [Candidatus Nanoperiomorbaceae bacterium]
MSDSPTNWAGKFFNTCLLILAGLIVLLLAVDILRSIWPWLVGAAAIAALMYAAIRWLQGRSDRW